ncbi:hypothetical protein [Microbacterium sp. ZW T5_56]|uniref:hypothetical protein n=1 Tax=Microbacterium sp. ZW T5_56 TaxID=3378081 RepID=UPI003853E9BF
MREAANDADRERWRAEHFRMMREVRSVDREEPNWDKLAAAAEAGEMHPAEGTAVTGEAAAQTGRDFLLAATGAATLDDAMRVALGRSGR